MSETKEHPQIDICLKVKLCEARATEDVLKDIFIYKYIDLDPEATY